MCWLEQDNMRVRHMDWADDFNRLQGKPDSVASKGALRDEAGEVVPDVDASETFDVIIGSDILYEVRHHSVKSLMTPPCIPFKGIQSFPHLDWARSVLACTKRLKGGRCIHASMNTHLSRSECCLICVLHYQFLRPCS